MARNALALAALAAALLSPGCATNQTAKASDRRDCAVMTAVLKQHYRIEPGSRLRLQRGDPKDADAYRITCDFKAAGIPIEDYDYDFVNTSREDFQGWISFAKPTYSGASATVETGYLMGPLAGAGQRCVVQSGIAGWTVAACKMTWIS